MIEYYNLLHKVIIGFLIFMTHGVLAQTTYMDQDFSGAGPFVASSPGTGQFSHLISTNPALSKYEFGPGYMDLIRLQQDSATGGIVRALRAVPFSPNPETLYIQISFSVEEINGAATNTVYFYLGENFSSSNNKIPANALLFSRFSLNFLTSSFVVHDIQTGRNSAALPLHTPVTLTWVLNNSTDGHIYRKPETAASPDYKVMPKKYDLWVNETLLIDEAAAYPGASAYSATKLSNFEIRFRNGVGKVRFDYIKIRDISGILPLHLISFEAKKSRDKIDLLWKTDLENDTDRFYLKKSKDRKSFDQVYAARAGAENYTFSDLSPFEGINYYRIEQVDKNENLIDSRMLEVSFDAGNSCIIMPNPASSVLIRVNTFYAPVNALKVHNMLGQNISFDYKLTVDGFIEIYPKQTMASGLYLLSFTQNDQSRCLRIVVE